MKRYLKMAAPYKGALILTVLALLGSSVVSLVMPDAVRRLTGALTDGTATKERVLVFAAVILLSYIVKALLTFVSKYKAHVAAWNFVGDMMLDVYNKLQSLSMRFFGDKQTGEIMSRVINDSRNMETLIAHALPDLLSNILIVIMVVNNDFFNQSDSCSNFAYSYPADFICNNEIFRQGSRSFQTQPRGACRGQRQGSGQYFGNP